MPVHNSLHVAQAAALPSPAQKKTQGPTEGRQGIPQNCVPGTPTPGFKLLGYPSRDQAWMRECHCGLGCCGRARQTPPPSRKI